MKNKMLKNIYENTFNKAVIYKIEHNEDPKIVYIGSTINFNERMTAHYGITYNTNSKNYNSKLYDTIRTNGGWYSFTKSILKAYPCSSKTELLIEETRIINELKPSINTRKAYNTTEDNKNMYKKYREANKDKLLIKEQKIRDAKKEERDAKKEEQYLLEEATNEQAKILIKLIKNNFNDTNINKEELNELYIHIYNKLTKTKKEVGECTK